MARILPYFVAVLTFIGVEAAFRRLIFFIPALLLILAITSTSLWELFGRKRSKRLGTLIGSNALLVGSTFCFLLFTERIIPRHIMAVALAGLLFLMLEQLSFFRGSDSEKLSGATMGFLLLAYTATIFWASASFYGLRTFFNVWLWPLAIIFFLIAYYFHWAILTNVNPALEKVKFRSLWLALIATELFVIAYASPTSLAVDGALVAVPMAVFLNVYRLRLEERLENKTFLRNVIFGALAIILVLITAQWT